ncbi:DUF917 domain-containing protein [Martelella alba]|uniref:DUF917 domain-containing protein n=1 Tax=Martelella alba TaxID=2590451 RepID=A0ABY2SLR0_9HYPH|nr:DUF917 domain-containing protein [Martelella alba]TKI06559.1 DUF917 domain-containing protein [Martelella alba]
MRLLDKHAIEQISIGASLLASGGGGDPYIGKIMALAAVEEKGPPGLLPVAAFKTDALLLSTGMIGSPTVMMEKVPNGDESLIACRLIEERLGRSIDGIYPIEAGGINSLLPLATAARLGLPVADLDAMGRAFPEFQMTTFHLDQVAASPFVVVDEKGDAAVIEAKDNVRAEKFARAVSVKMGGAAIFAAYPISPAQAAASGIIGTLSQMRRLGEQVEAARRGKRDVLTMLVDALGGHILFRGKAVMVDQRSEGGFTRGMVGFVGIDDYQGRRFDVFFQNEYLLAQCGQRPLCMTPDLILLLDEDTGRPILGERLRYGVRVAALGVPANARWRTARGIDVAGPRYFRYQTDYIAVETLAAAQEG